ncbi:hypothetical protein Pmar_PMAR010263 [Perkinsus marinus ATCC 50983]|uniref:Uncharacterized protein n=1 Tax=Perkinsus marinus (strain ATCC 50983 / TXsc) TaxID=423536 RepID=C5K595_PERM5|nr:hypothetical protein Pmar_PMAR010263 [Perkinsus marinus ATCC 50983]EER20517.1 hypothetical protein Pmar_PMAR010263 [Perkinsus marinus ATCC 50983]|eukprot:XP_002788721.1 hypothetical protein Pmar_PMAR010263 [Perkinsus marinus ATCC 50983]
MPPPFRPQASKSSFKPAPARGDRKAFLRQDFPRPLSRREQDFLHRDMERELMRAPPLLPTAKDMSLVQSTSTVFIHPKLDLCLDQAVKSADVDLDRAVKNVFDVVESLPSREGLTRPDLRMQALVNRVANRIQLSSVDTLFYAAMLGLSVAARTATTSSRSCYRSVEYMRFHRPTS